MSGRETPVRDGASGSVFIWGAAERALGDGYLAEAKYRKAALLSVSIAYGDHPGERTTPLVLVHTTLRDGGTTGDELLNLEGRRCGIDSVERQSSRHAVLQWDALTHDVEVSAGRIFEWCGAATVSCRVFVLARNYGLPPEIRLGLVRDLRLFAERRSWRDAPQT